MLMNLTRAAEVLGMSVLTIRRRISSGEWPAYKLGPKSTRVDPDEIKSLGRLISQSELQGRKESESA